jgi:hypothetical protein
MKTLGSSKPSGLSWLALSAAAFMAAWPCGAKDIIVHARTHGAPTVAGMD